MCEARPGGERGSVMAWLQGAHGLPGMRTRD